MWSGGACMFVCIFWQQCIYIRSTEKHQWSCFHITIYNCTQRYDCGKGTMFWPASVILPSEQQGLHFVIKEQHLAGSLCRYPCYCTFRSVAFLSLPDWCDWSCAYWHCCQTPSYPVAAVQAVWRQFSCQFRTDCTSGNKHVIWTPHINR